MIAVAVSGGMDSLLALALLREAGHDVLALHAHFLPPGQAQLHLARALRESCAGMGVAFEDVDLSEAFREGVIEPFAAAYAAGSTPNPCAGCNRDMKFGLLFEEAARLGADRIATGHYVRLRPEGSAPATLGGETRSAPDNVARGPGSREGGDSLPPGQAGLFRGLDPAKDQSYFLTLTPWGSLKRAVFPLGDWRKADVPAALAARNLAPPLPSESQEVCFIPGDDYRAFLEARGTVLPGPGPVLLSDGREIGRHRGLWRYTIGQRKGIGIAWSEPLYVLDKLPERNGLIVGPKSGLDSFECRVRDLNLLVPPQEWPEIVLAQTCYRQKPRPARVGMSVPEPVHSSGAARPSEAREGEEMILRFESAVPRPTPGQVAAVFDREGRALAGGIIA